MYPLSEIYNFLLPLLFLTHDATFCKGGQTLTSSMHRRHLRVCVCVGRSVVGVTHAHQQRGQTGGYIFRLANTNPRKELSQCNVCYSEGEGKPGYLFITHTTFSTGYFLTYSLAALTLSVQPVIVGLCSYVQV